MLLSPPRYKTPRYKGAIIYVLFPALYRTKAMLIFTLINHIKGKFKASLVLLLFAPSLFGGEFIDMFCRTTTASSRMS